ncbi:alpha/beta hydrolase [Haloarcula taiwanensis]|uniref:Alpha/beta hydrolase n=1 Tax=Haloarcula taiwanensis TaxID=1932004 RepID=A0A2H4ZV49_9EURY|nr:MULTISPECIES: alpha/beta hydrolase [Haloarcula]AUG46348.1 alpha/beta hydrolase [Haloarcula taiwanensis]RLM36566.1 alpha/beta hydrolase [Haloarcula sp. Atlit-120R]RLM45050.1 alpha/beta hydrolase [Haloarcula sp. Atlit-47R]
MQQAQSTDEIDVEFERYGDGQPLILLHGGMAPTEYWEPVIPAFEGYSAVVPQRPGFGTCLDSPAETSADEVLAREGRYVRALTDAVDGDPILFGHSYGALTAIEAAAALSVEAVIAYEPAVLPAEYRADADLADQMASLIRDGAREEAVKRYIEHVLHPDGIDDLDAWLADWPVWPDCVDLAEEVVRMNRSVEQYQLPDRLNVDAPTLVLAGTDGPDFLRQSARSVHEALPRSRFVEFEGVSHSGPAEAPALIAAEVDTFLQN